MQNDDAALHCLSTHSFLFNKLMRPAVICLQFLYATQVILSAQCTLQKQSAKEIVARNVFVRMVFRLIRNKNDKQQ